jgi:hypothetical protein
MITIIKKIFKYILKIDLTSKKLSLAQQKLVRVRQLIQQLMLQVLQRLKQKIRQILLVNQSSSLHVTQTASSAFSLHKVMTLSNTRNCNARLVNYSITLHILVIVRWWSTNLVYAPACWLRAHALSRRIALP